ncbi:hypothetical protein ACO0KY_11665 [Undibacterium sp. Dicai25W]|uniref:hypothetical protein n=1 Tax=Undibacterium sp. Dicai25W TaxID=3413034 RepID=UPI003BF189E2
MNLWQEVNNRDLLSEFSEERFLTDQDISSLRDHSLLNTRAVRKWVNKKLNISAIRLSVAHPTRKIPIDTVLKSYALSRIIDFADYLSFIARAMLRQRSNFSEIEPRIIQMKQKILSQKPKGFSGRSSNFDPDTKAPPAEIFEQFIVGAHSKILNLVTRSRRHLLKWLVNTAKSLKHPKQVMAPKTQPKVWSRYIKTRKVSSI